MPHVRICGGGDQRWSYSDCRGMGVVGDSLSRVAVSAPINRTLYEDLPRPTTHLNRPWIADFFTGARTFAHLIETRWA